MLLLRQAGYDILARNFRCRMGELDIVARRGRLLVIAAILWPECEVVVDSISIHRIGIAQYGRPRIGASLGTFAADARAC